ncbi:class I SAM-dependent methyltransferase [Aestuariispira insulae]|uniref:S-adenosylmethionine-dependent methyltransferase n=1 Tax=Aestuariispira insulae TaxID=1461337 RepID=A0A3D9HQZ7_9PROT|nr:class I SAM-dependent methyltransferase [Aestuariispira insulae]RED51326.1 S-adenosylmethionine-dependent methyltransferase [Aestuariispira insulae]
MSRLDSVIRRLQAQRACLDCAAENVAGKQGVILEMGLGNGRTFDHLRDRLPDHEIHVFEREVRAHPDCVPDQDHLFLGDMRETLLQAEDRLKGSAVLIHADIGTGDEERNRAFADWLGPALRPFLAPDAVIVCDQEMRCYQAFQMDLPDGISPGRYFMYNIK